METIEKANEIHAGLEAKLRAAQLDLARIEDGRASVSYAAHTGDAAAAKRLKDLDAERSGLVGRIASIEVAIAEAARRVADATRAAEAEVLRRRAEEARPIALRLKVHAAAIDVGLQSAKAALAAFQDDARALARLGAPIARAELIKVNVDRALDSALWGLLSKSRSPNRRKWLL